MTIAEFLDDLQMIFDGISWENWTLFCVRYILCEVFENIEIIKGDE